MTEKNRFSKPVAFNKKNADDRLILEYTKRRNFSGYAKKLMLADIKAKLAEKQEKQKRDEFFDQFEENDPMESIKNMNDPDEKLTLYCDGKSEPKMMTQREMNELRLKEAQKKVSKKPTEL